MMMADWTQLLVQKDTTLKDAIRLMDETHLQIVLVTDENRRLLGVITDGDIRRAILRGITIQDPAYRAMNPKPIVADAQENRDRLLKRMSTKHLRHIPIVDAENKLVGLEIHPELLTPETRNNWIVLMAGGLGRRLLPLTEQIPKPLLPVGNTPVLETILKNFVDFGFQKFFLCINYKGEMIQEHFDDGSRFGAQIQYLRENQPMGTAGALGRLAERPSEPFVVMNADLLTTLNPHRLLDFHRDRKAVATMCVREYAFQVPYGMVRIEKEQITGIDEKPIQRVFVNAGIYVMDPSVLDFVQRDTPLDMPELFKSLIAADQKTAAFPVREYWTDIGQPDDLHRANDEFKEVFKREP